MLYINNKKGDFMTSGKIGTETNIIIRTPKRKKVKANCKICINRKTNVCGLGRKLGSDYCKWYAANTDYNNLNNEEKKSIKKLNNISKSELKERSKYNNGFGAISVGTVDLSKYKKYR